MKPYKIKKAIYAVLVMWLTAALVGLLFFSLTLFGNISVLVSPELMFGGEIHFGYSNYKNRYQESKQQNYEAAEFLQKRLMSVDWFNLIFPMNNRRDVLARSGSILRIKRKKESYPWSFELNLDGEKTFSLLWKKLYAGQSRGDLFFLDDFGNDLLSMKSVAEGEKNRLEERGERLLISKLVRNVQTESLAEMNRPVIVLQSPDSLLFNDIFSSSRSEKIFVFRDLDILLTQLREDPLYLKKMLDLIKGESIERQKGLGELFQSNFSLDQLIKLRSWELPFVNWRWKNLPVDKKHDLFFDVNDKKNKINSSSEKLYRVNDPNFNPIKPWIQFVPRLLRLEVPSSEAVFDLDYSDYLIGIEKKNLFLKNKLILYKDEATLTQINEWSELIKNSINFKHSFYPLTMSQFLSSIEIRSSLFGLLNISLASLIFFFIFLIFFALIRFSFSSIVYFSVIFCSSFLLFFISLFFSLLFKFGLAASWFVSFSVIALFATFSWSKSIERLASKFNDLSILPRVFLPRSPRMRLRSYWKNHFFNPFCLQLLYLPALGIGIIWLDFWPLIYSAILLILFFFVFILVTLFFFFPLIQLIMKIFSDEKNE